MAVKPTKGAVLERQAHESRSQLIHRMRGHVRPDGGESPLRQAYAAASRLQYAQRPAHPYKGRLYNFLAHCVDSVDESGAGAIRAWPVGRGRDGRSWDRYWLELEDLVLRNKLVMFEKSRRVLASWFVCAFDIWLCAGGQDPRWLDETGRPVLMFSDRNRQVYLQARKAEGAAGSEWFIEQRVKRILEQFEEGRGRKAWPDFPQWEFRCGEITFSNGSKITGVPQGANQIRGAAATLLHCEEFAFWEQARATIQAAVPTMRGGGHIIGITTPQVGSYAKEIRDGKVARS